MGFMDKLNTARRNTAVQARQVYSQVRQDAGRAYEGAKVAHGKYNAYQEEQYRRKLAQVRKQKALVQAEAAVARAQAQKRTYGTSSRMEQHSLQNQGYRTKEFKEGRVQNDMDRQGGYQGGYKQYGGEAPLFHRPNYAKQWWEL